MKRISSKWLIPFCSVYGAVMLWAGATHNFAKLSVGTMTPSFADLRLITSASECNLSGHWNINSLTCDPWGRIFNYPTTWVKLFSALHIRQGNTDLIGLLEISLFILSFTYFLMQTISRVNSRIKKTTILTIGFIFAFSPTVLLLLERGNVDLFMFSGLTLVTVLLLSNLELISSLLVAILGAFKIYPFAALIGIFSNEKLNTKKLRILIPAFIAFLLVLKDLSYVANRSETDWSSIAYGVSILPLGVNRKLHLGLDRQTSFLIGLASFTLITIMFYKFFGKHFRAHREIIDENRFAKISTLVFGPVFLTTYLLGTSYDFRLIFIFPVILSLILTSQKNSEVISYILTFAIIILGGSFPFGIVNGISDIVIMFFSSYLFLLQFKVLVSPPNIFWKEIKRFTKR